MLSTSKNVKKFLSVCMALKETMLSTQKEGKGFIGWLIDSFLSLANTDFNDLE